MNNYNPNTFIVPPVAGDEFIKLKDVANSLVKLIKISKITDLIISNNVLCILNDSDPIQIQFDTFENANIALDNFQEAKSIALNI